MQEAAKIAEPRLDGASEPNCPFAVAEECAEAHRDCFDTAERDTSAADTVDEIRHVDFQEQPDQMTEELLVHEGVDRLQRPKLTGLLMAWRQSRLWADSVP